MLLKGPGVDAQNPARLRQVTAGMAVCTGAAHIASLWFRALTPEALGSLLLGTVYLFIGLGLIGRSRLSLYLAATVPCAAFVLALRYGAEGTGAAEVIARLADLLLAALGCAVLWRRFRTGAA